MAQEVKPTYVAYISTWLVAVQTKHFFTIINLNGVLVLQFDDPYYALFMAVLMG